MRRVERHKHWDTALGYYWPSDDMSGGGLSASWQRLTVRDWNSGKWNWVRRVHSIMKIVLNSWVLVKDVGNSRDSLITSGLKSSWYGWCFILVFEIFEEKPVQIFAPLKTNEISLSETHGLEVIF